MQEESPAGEKAIKSQTAFFHWRFDDEILASISRACLRYGCAGALLNLVFGITYLLYDEDPVVSLQGGLPFVLIGCLFCVGLFTVCGGAVYLPLHLGLVLSGTSSAQSRFAGIAGGIVGFVLVFWLWSIVAKEDAYSISNDMDPGLRAAYDREYREGLNYCLKFGIVGQVVLHHVGAMLVGRSGPARPRRFQFPLKDWFVATGAGAMLFAIVSLVDELAPSVAQGLTYCLVTQAALTCGQVWLYPRREKPAG